MKTKIILIIIAAFLVGCSNQDSIELENTIADMQDNNNDILSYEEALSIAESSISMLDHNSASTRSHEKSRKINCSEKKAYTNNIKTRADSDDNDTLIYVFNFEDNDGFALVSASRNTEALLAITDKGHCNPDEKSEIQGFELFVEMAKNYVSNAKKTPILRKPQDPIVEIRDSITSICHEIGPFVSVNWGQTLPEGESCPNGISGCANTAMAQIMSYYNYPTSINLTYLHPDSVLYLDWSAMKAHSTGHNRNSCVDQTTHDAISKLLRQLGALNNSTYYSNVTNTDEDNVPYTFTILGYPNSGWETYSRSEVHYGLNNHKLYYMCGYSIGGGHGWVFDGGDIVNSTIYHYGRTATSGWFLMNISHETDYYLHFNWGWYGDCNGYFLEGIFDTTQAYSYDHPTNVHNYDFSIGTYVWMMRINL